MAAVTERPFHDELWTCPECGHRFVTANSWHSCSNYTIDSHFEGCAPAVRESFDAFIAAIQECGAVEVIPQKTRIAIQARVRFAGCIVRKRWLLANLWLTRRVQHPLLQRCERFGPNSFGHQFRLSNVSDVDESLRALIAESYQVGLRHHVHRRGRG